jgi:hypothetical protein
MNNNDNKGRCALFLSAFSEASPLRKVLRKQRGDERPQRLPTPPSFTAPAIPGRVLASRACVRFAGAPQLTWRAAAEQPALFRLRATTTNTEGRE